MGNLAQIWLSLNLYADNWGSWTPPEQPVAPGDNYTACCSDHHPTWGPWAGCHIWGELLGEASDSPAYYSGENGWKGIGCLVGEKYVVRDMMICPALHFDGYKWWRRRAHIGAAYSKPYTVPEEGGVDWSPYLGGSNYYYEGTYAFRSGDWCSLSQANRHIKNCRMVRKEYPRHAIMIEANNWHHDPVMGGNVVWGDGSVFWWPDLTKYQKFALHGAPGYVHSGLFANADEYIEH